MRGPKELLKMREEAEEAARSARPSAPTLKTFVMQNAGLIESIRRARYQADPSDVWGWIARELVARGLVSGEVKAETLKTYCKQARKGMLPDAGVPVVGLPDKVEPVIGIMSAHARNIVSAGFDDSGTPAPPRPTGEAGGRDRDRQLRMITELLDASALSGGLTPLDEEDGPTGVGPMS